MVLRGSRQAHPASDASSGVPRPYIPLGIIAAGLIIAYHAYNDYRTIDGMELAGLFLFGLAFAGALAIKLFVADKFDPKDNPPDGERSVAEPQPLQRSDKQDKDRTDNMDMGGREG